VGKTRAIGFALGVLLVSSGPAVAPLHAGSAIADAPGPAACAPLAPSAIALGCANESRDWLGVSFLARDPLAAPRPGATRDAAPSLVAERLDAASELASVPEPLPLFGLGLGLAILAVARRAHSG
jgi:hypothetical protein